MEEFFVYLLVVTSIVVIVTPDSLGCFAERSGNLFDAEDLSNADL